MLRFAITGNPVEHSLSPTIFNTAFKKYNIDAKYIKLYAKSAVEALYLANAIKLDFLNITAPYKKDIAKLILSGSERIDIVNTIIFKDSKAYSYNTDIDGLIYLLEKYKLMTQHLKIGILGAGATAESFLKSLEQHTKNSLHSTEPLNLTFIVRNIEKAKMQINKMFNPSFFDNIKFININRIEHTLEFDLLFCGIPSKEMIGNEYILDKITAKTVLDINYTKNIYKDYASKVGAVYISGLELLLSQAMYGFRHYFGYKPNFETPTQNEKIDTIIFTGFSGSGKTTIGKHFAELINAAYFDTDSIIEAETGRRISDIFSNEGEAYFRNLEEKQILKILSISGKKVISLGGGASLANINDKLKNCRTVWLYSDLPTCISRIEINDKPKLSNLSTTEIEELFVRRQELYFNNADAIILNQDNKNIIEQLYAEISISLNS